MHGVRIVFLEVAHGSMELELDFEVQVALIPLIWSNSERSTDIFSFFDSQSVLKQQQIK